MPADERAAVGLQILDTRFTAEWLADPEHAGDAALVRERGAGAASDDPEVRRGMREQLLARSHHDVADRLPRITCPTLVAGGRYDGIAPPENSAAIAARIAGAELRMYEGGHAFLGQDRQAFPDVLAFLA